MLKKKKSPHDVPNTADKIQHNEILRVKDLEVQYITDQNTIYAINGVSFSVKSGETVGLVGETGAGKTTTALSILRLVPDPPGKIIKGEILFENQNILKMNKTELRKLRGAKISMIFQDPMTALNPMQTVGDQIAEVVRLHESLSKKDAQKRGIELLELVGIPGERFDEYPHQFSGGMKQRVVIAMALACNPRLLLADEPTTALDVTIQAQVLELINGLKEKLNTSMLLITHDLGVVAEVCDRVMIMYAGEIVEGGTLEDVYNNTHHPYTKGLFHSLPDLEVESKRLNAIPGLMPDPSNLPLGCKFCPRCTCNIPVCETEEPRAVEIAPGHIVKCHLYTPGGKEQDNESLIGS